MEVIVIDNGSDTMKAGFAGQTLPRLTFPTVIGKLKNLGSAPALKQKDNYVGDEAQRKRDILTLKHPIEHGIITNWDDMEKIWHNTFYNELCITPKEHPILLTEPPMNPKLNSEKMTQIMFETMTFPFVYVANTHVTSLLASGRTSGIVTDCGDGMCLTVPIYEGRPFNYCVLKFDLDGSALTDYMIKRLLSEKAYNIPDKCLFQVAKDIKEKLCYVAMDYEKELTAFQATPGNTEQYYQLPDGRIITVGSERFRCPESFFQPSFAGMEMAGIHECVYNTICKCTSISEWRKDMYANVVLAGGSSLFPGFLGRMKKELDALAPSGFKVEVSSPPQPKYSSWIGGSLIASRPDFLHMCMSQEEYDEFGPSLVHRKCF